MSIISNKDTIFLSAFDYNLGEYGHQVEGIHIFPSANRWENRSSEHNIGSSFEGLQLEESKDL
jgi:hypothetical protein